MIRLTLLGSTGSIGRQTVDIAAGLGESIRVVALTAHSNDTLIEGQADLLHVTTVALVDPDAAVRLRERRPDLEVLAGSDAVVSLASAPSDIVLNALVGAAGLRASLSALESGARLALANKESLVAGGGLVMATAAPGQLIPVDSEHSAIFQCLVGETPAETARIWLTASGGPFRGMDRARLAQVTLEQALAHPRWSMGPKITIDSSTLMNKGLEVIEAHHLFGLDYDDITVLVHPQSCIHSMVEFVDGSVKAHLGATDMRVPIQYALSYPSRWDAPVAPVDFFQIRQLDFEEPDTETFGCLRLAFEAGRLGGTAPAILNAANEIAVAAFLEERCSLLDIERVVEAVLTEHVNARADTIEAIEAADGWARQKASDLL